MGGAPDPRVRCRRQDGVSARPAPLTREDIAAAIAAVGVRRNDTVLVHSALYAPGPVEGGASRVLPTYAGAFEDVLGPEGTLVVPAYFYEYGRWEQPYDVVRSPVSRELGVFAQYVAARPGAVRSLNPISALAAVGPAAEYVCRGGTGSSYGVDSPWDRLRAADATMVFVGCDAGVMTYVHYVEHMVGVPHLYNKLYRAAVLEDGEALDVRIVAQVRYQEFEIEYDTASFTPRLAAAGILRSAHLGHGRIHAVSCAAVFDHLKAELERDPFALLVRPPRFVAGRIPTDGPAGAAR